MLISDTSPSPISHCFGADMSSSMRLVRRSCEKRQRTREQLRLLLAFPPPLPVCRVVGLRFTFSPSSGRSQAHMYTRHRPRPPNVCCVIRAPPPTFGRGYTSSAIVVAGNGSYPPGPHHSGRTTQALTALNRKTTRSAPPPFFHTRLCRRAVDAEIDPSCIDTYEEAMARAKNR